MQTGTLVQPPVPIQAEGKKFGVRAGAYIIDTLIFGVATYAISFLVGIIFGLLLAILGVNFPTLPSGTTFAEYAISFVATTFYFIFFEWIYGATPGKIILSMRVIMDDGRPCTFVAALVRALLRYIDGFFFGVPAAVVMRAPFYKRIGDNSAHTIVVSSKSLLIQKHRPGWMFFVAAVVYLIFHSLLVLLLLLTYL